MSNPDPEEALALRLERIESVLAHLQHDVDSLNSTILGYFSRLQELDSRFGRLEHELQALHEPSEGTDAVSDRPPHY